MDSESEYEQQQPRGGAVGKRLRVDGHKRTEVEYRQMLRLCEIENQELKNSLRYVEIQLAKSKDSKRDMMDKYEAAQGEIEKCHENIQRQANINHAQAKQIEEMSGQLDGIAASQKAVHDQAKVQIQQYQNEIDMREMDINRIKKTLEGKDNECEHVTTQFNMQSDRMADIEEELEMKAGENNRLRKQCADMEAAMQDLYQSRKGNGSLQIELDSLKQDNERLLALLKETAEYGEMDDATIQNEAMRGSASKPRRAGSASGKSRKSTASASELGGQGGPQKGKGKNDNDWIPTQAVRAILLIKENFKGQMSETCISQILYQLNSIWRDIMRKENAAVKKKLVAQIADLKRQVVSKQAYDKEELMSEIHRSKKQLAFANKKIYDTKMKAEGAGSTQSTQGGRAINQVELENSMKLVEAINSQKRAVENENDELKSQISEMLNQRTQNLATAIDMNSSSGPSQFQRPGIPPLNFTSNSQGGIY